MISDGELLAQLVGFRGDPSLGISESVKIAHLEPISVSAL